MLHSLKRTAVPILIVFFMALVFWLPRLLVVERAVTADEARWLLRSGNFYQALASGDLAATYQHEHPGVTVTWAGALGYVWRFRTFPQLAGEQLPGPSSLENLFSGQGRQPLQVLAAGRSLVVLSLGLILALAGWYAARLLGWWAAGIGLGLIAFDPFSLSLTYLLQPDGLNSSLMLLSVLAFLCYWQAGRRRLDLLISALAGGLAVLSKSPAVFLLPFLGLAGLGWLARSEMPAPGPARWAPARWGRSAGPLLAWVGIAAVTFVAFWPAMWVDPLATLQKVFGEAFRYASEGNLNSIFFNGRIYPEGSSAWYFYPVAIAWRVTPIGLAGILLAAGRWIMAYRRPDPERNPWLSIGTLFAYAGLYVLAISLGGQKYDRYILPAWLALLLLAGWGWAGLTGWLGQRAGRRLGAGRQAMAGLALAAAVLAGQGLGAAQVYPYYNSYYNPLLGGLGRATRVWTIGWGEGLDQAGEYLDSLPNAAGLRVISWYADGCFSYFFRGRALGMDRSTTLADVKQMDYVVVYYQQYQRQEPSPEILAYLGDLTPFKVIRVSGLDLVTIYRIRG
jgi:hypothetical protein